MISALESDQSNVDSLPPQKSKFFASTAENRGLGASRFASVILPAHTCILLAVSVFSGRYDVLHSTQLPQQSAEAAIGYVQLSVPAAAGSGKAPFEKSW
jgi:hypothetical protein